jgi:hypothetical protein
VSEGRRIVVLGAMAQMPFAGVAWQVLHYLEGFRRLGHDVTYVEDTGAWPYDPVDEGLTDDATRAVARLRRLLEAYGFDRWSFRNGARPDELSGMSVEELRRALAEAEILVNLTGATVLRDEHRAVPVRVYLETDPVRPQIEVARGDEFTIALLADHTHHFTFGERVGRSDCPVPVERFEYRPTRQPIVIDWWRRADGRPAGQRNPRFTTVGNWSQPQKDVEWQGEHYGWSKSEEFAKLIDLPRRVGPGVVLELALALEDQDVIDRLRRAGWRVRPAAALSHDTDAYRDYVAGSHAEFTVAKDQNVRLRSGWFSDRTASYLAAGRPAVVQDTGFDVALPVGEGLLAFESEDEAASAVAEVAGDHPRHAAAAAAIADEYFRAETVLARLVAEVGG